MNRKRPTMKDVALRAGVSQPTVSYVINGTASVTDEVRNKVFRAIDELGYTRNMYARALRTQCTDIIGILIPDIRNLYFASLVGQLERDFAGRYTVFVGSTNYNGDEEAKILHQMISYDVRAIILTYQLMSSACWDLLRQSEQQVIAMECGDYAAGFVSINVDNRYGGYLATRHLLDHGRKHIAYVVQNVKSDTLLDRQRGYLQAMEEAGLPPYVFPTEVAGNFWQEGLTLGVRIIENGFDGVVTSSDILAVGILRKLLASRIRVPKDVAVVGYDDIALAELFVPPLTTIRQPMIEMCSNAVESVCSNKRVGEINLRPALVVRATTLPDAEAPECGLEPSKRRNGEFSAKAAQSE